MTTALTLHHDIDAEPRIHDEELGRRLGYSRARDIRSLITDNETELQRYGNFPRRTENSTGRGRKGEAYYLNEPQALLICMKSEAPVAADIRQEVIEVYMAFRKGCVEAELERLRVGREWLTVDLFRALRKERWRRSFARELGTYAARIAAARGTALKKERVRYSGGFGLVNVYPKSLLEEAYARCATLLRFPDEDAATVALDATLSKSVTVKLLHS